jgi:hypothetical protein
MELILAGGKKGNRTLDDIYSLDLHTSLWTKLPNTPRPAAGAVCVSVSDQFIYWGGSSDSGMNEQGPAILNLTSKTWGTTYTPEPLPSSADRVHLALSAIGLAMVTMISTLIL